MALVRRGGAHILKLIESGADPAAIANVVQLYSKDDGGVTQLFARASDGTISQLTPPASGSSALAAALGDTPIAIANVETVITSFTIPGNTLVAGSVITWAASAGRAGANAVAPTIRVRVGPVTLTGAELYGNSTLVTANPGGSYWHGAATIHTIGAGGQGNGGGFQAINSSATATVNNCSRNIDAAIDTTVDNLVELTFISGNAGNTYTFNMAAMFYYQA